MKKAVTAGIVGLLLLLGLAAGYTQWQVEADRPQPEQISRRHHLRRVAPYNQTLFGANHELKPQPESIQLKSDAVSKSLFKTDTAYDKSTKKKSSNTQITSVTIK
ncbi:hypothetical protein [Lactobacillus corticis]|uniref:Uncharacterized protein n=1 Tax=Lactobacillus corticis TaxID=2201249 RepID=A0A916VH70_9LACO|nr:hypothetical protein [Lactobacillus corticis]GFZ26312.1 hypothetical protein LCB40_01920 [Lactobacillus corticis]